MRAQSFDYSICACLSLAVHCSFGAIVLSMNRHNMSKYIPTPLATMSLAPTPSLRDRLLGAEEKSLSLISEDISAMQDFYDIWSMLGMEVAQAIEQNSTDSETLSIAHRVADRVQILASRFLSFYEDVDAVTLAFQRELDALFATLSIEDGSPPPSSGGSRSIFVVW